MIKKNIQFKEFIFRKHLTASAMLIVIFILSGIFVVAFAAGYRVFFSVKTGDIQSQSLRAAAAAQTGEERARYELQSGTFPTSTCPAANIFGTTTLSNQSSYTIDCLTTSSPYSLQVNGNFKNVQRRSNVTIAAANCSVPIIFNIEAIDITESTATIQFEVDKGNCVLISLAGVEYGLTTDYDLSLSTSDSQTVYTFALEGLTGNTVYHFRVYVYNNEGALTASPDQTFTTLGGG
jgi:hypothetical protein